MIYDGEGMLADWDGNCLDVPSTSILKPLIKEERGAAESQPRGRPGGKFYDFNLDFGCCFGHVLAYSCHPYG